MSWSKSVTLWCDDDECMIHQEFSAATVGRAEYKAKKDGWSKASSGEHYCPDCVGDNDE